MEERYILGISGRKNLNKRGCFTMAKEKNENVIESSLKRKYKLQAKDVNVFYGDFQAIKEISMDIKANSVTAFIGPSGCGKSTFLRLFNRTIMWMISEWRERSL